MLNTLCLLWCSNNSRTFLHLEGRYTICIISISISFCKHFNILHSEQFVLTSLFISSYIWCNEQEINCQMIYIHNIKKVASYHGRISAGTLLYIYIYIYIYIPPSSFSKTDSVNLFQISSYYDRKQAEKTKILAYMHHLDANLSWHVLTGSK